MCSVFPERQINIYHMSCITFSSMTLSVKNKVSSVYCWPIEPRILQPAPSHFLCNVICLPLDGECVHLSNILQPMSWSVLGNTCALNSSHRVVAWLYHFYLKTLLSLHHKLWKITTTIWLTVISQRTRRAEYRAWSQTHRCKSLK